MADFSQEEDFLSFLNDFPEDLFGANEEKDISSDALFNAEPYLRLSVQVEDSNLTHVPEETVLGRKNESPPPTAKCFTESSIYRTISSTFNASRKRKQMADELLDDSDSDDAESNSSDSQEKSLKFAEKFLSFGIRCKQNFWQYNQESRGPKAKRLLPAIDKGDFHVLNSCIDPAFDSTQNVINSNNHNKARHGGASDLRPDPLKLLHIGSRISEMEELFKSKDVKDSGKKRKANGREKNILASRISRLRKKAQHEANKIKLEGLQKEQHQLIGVSVRMLNVMQEHIVKSAVQPNAGHSTMLPLCALLKAYISEHLGFMVAGHTVEFVNRELELVAKQLLSGGVNGGDEQSDGEG